MRWSWLLATLIACDEYGMAAGLKDTSVGSSTAEDLSVLDLDPAYGPLAGGTSVVVTGTGFTDETVLSFGNLALDMTVLSADELIFTTPSSPSEGRVDLVVEDAVESITLEDAFLYTNDAPDNGGNGNGGNGSGGSGNGNGSGNGSGNNGNGSTPSGLTGGYAELWKKAFSCPECLGMPSGQNLVVEGGVGFNSPNSGSWFSWVPPLNSCFTQANEPTIVADVQYGGWVTLSSSTGSISLQHNSATGLYENAAMSASVVSAFTPFDLAISSENVTLTSALVTPQTFSMVEPANAWAMGLEYAFQQPFSLSTFQVLWGPTGTQDNILFLAEVWDSAGTQFKGQVMCNSSDTGGLGLDPSLTAAFTVNDLLIVSIYRIQMTDTVNPIDGHTIEGIGGIGLIGTGYFTP